MLRSCNRLRKALIRGTFPGWDLQLATSDGVLRGFCIPPVCSAAIRLCHSGKLKDYSLPNSSWSQEMMDQFNKLTEMTKDKTWERLTSYRHTLAHYPESVKQTYNLRDKGTRLFLRNLDTEGMGFEYVMFLNRSEKKMAGVFQFGPYLEGPPGFAHGGSIATVLDTVLGSLAMCVTYRVMTANLNINYKSPTPLGSVVLVESKLDRVEGRKVFVTGEMRSVDGRTVHADATGLFIQLQSVPSSNQA
ncbi:acyl-coenzyme A thioesterase THEM4-like [Sceloporus undulatus]|uniref:acyl-coenzyme A thioesterase THEM4-like n=1 Tax=Sceloporus undulatus TaxID=8520 RepID=UPI001C4C3071|nr:acyl-coenzyme A thioesterase THEM4-like [Sceloporus undulatus]XP_042296995.1 acyl-coenzyme A thioesterase THEM4-like [Sceloporus undulatus]XP_042296996.1 acyl-coenzyme A thioesterase THEM4-like [Sceloporus undulatus]